MHLSIGIPAKAGILDVRAEAKRGVDGMLAKQATYCSWAPSEPSSSAGLCGSARKRASTTDFGQLFERSGQGPRSEFCPTRKDRAAQSSRP